MSSSILLVASSLLILVAQATIYYENCMIEGDFGGNEEKGHLYKTCTRDHQFISKRFVWILTKSKFFRTTFDSCTFHDTDTKTQSFSETKWSEVTFSHCTFRNSNMSFVDSTLDRVNFINCTFRDNVHIHFERFLMQSVLFKNCNFGDGTMHVTRGEVHSVEFNGCTFGTQSVRSKTSYKTEDQGGDIQFSYVTVRNLLFHDCRGDTNAISFAHASIEDLDIRQSTFGLLNCSTNTLTSEEDNQRHVQLVHAVVINSSFTNGVSCLNAMVDRLFVWNTEFGELFNLSNSLVISPILRSLQSMEGTMDLSHTVIQQGMQLQSININKVTFDHAHIHATTVSFLSTSSLEPAVNTGAEWTWHDDSISLSSTVFPSFLIGSQCCSTLCAMKQCKCNETAIDEQIEQSANLTQDQCPSLNSSTRYSEKSDNPACFPASARMHVSSAGGSHGQDRVRMDRVTLGMVSDPPSYGSVYFFGHADHDAVHDYVSIKVSIPGSNLTRQLFISTDHLVPVITGQQQPGARQDLKAAGELRQGDQLQCMSDKEVDGHSVCVVRTIGRERRLDKGVFAPVTTSGRMVVDGVVVSCFTTHVKPPSAQALLLPLRMVHVFGGKIGRRVLLERCVWLHRRSAAQAVRRVACAYERLSGVLRWWRVVWGARGATKALAGDSTWTALALCANVLCGRSGSFVRKAIWLRRFENRDGPTGSVPSNSVIHT